MNIIKSSNLKMLLKHRYIKFSAHDTFSFGTTFTKANMVES